MSAISLSRLHRGVNRLVHWLAPAECLLCRAPHTNTRAICADCEARLSRNTHSCHRCALPHLPSALCRGCRYAPPHFETTHAPYLMRTGIRDLIHQWKFQNRPHLSTLLASLFVEATFGEATRLSTTGLGCSASAGPTVLVPIPTQWRRQVQRGFDHTWVLAHGLKSQHYPSLMVRPWLRNRGPRKAQHLLDRATRWQDATDRFTADSKLAGHRVILVDDVMTTGATARAAARVCREAGAQSVDVWCLARTPAPITAR